MFYYFKDKHKLLEVKLEFKGHNYMFNSYEMDLYSEVKDRQGESIRLLLCLYSKYNLWNGHISES
jgi:hypothetical protein